MVTRPKIRLLRYLIPVIIVLALFFCFRRCDNQQKQPLPPRDYADIIREGVITCSDRVQFHQFLCRWGYGCGL